MADETGLDDRGRIALGRRLIANALHYSAAKVAATSTLRDLKHDADLLPLIQRRLQVILEGFHRDSNVVYDIQGRNDQGCDLLVRLSTDNGVQFIGLQVKSHSELLNEDVIPVLIRQHFEATSHYSPMLIFYIVLAADMTQNGPQHRVIRAIQQKFSTAKDVRIVIPEYTATFIRLGGPAIDALITQTMRTGDPVTTAGVQDLRRHPVEAAILLRLVERHLAGAPVLSRVDLISDQWIQAVAEATPIKRFRDTPFARPIDGRFHQENEYRVYTGLPLSAEADIDFDEEIGPNKGDWWFLDEYLEEISSGLRRHLLLPNDQAGPDAAARLSEFVPDALDLLEDDLDSVDEDGDQFSIRLDEHMALVALAAEGIVKHRLVGDDVINYVVNLLLPAD